MSLVLAEALSNVLAESTSNAKISCPHHLVSCQGYALGGSRFRQVAVHPYIYYYFVDISTIASTGIMPSDVYSHNT